MRRLVLAGFGAAIAMVGSALAASGAGAAALCVGTGPHCHPTIQAALDAAHDGDRIRIGPGTFEGGVTIAVSVRLVGAGAHSTIIRGGGPVLTIGVLDAPSVPTVKIKGVTITGGVTSSSSHCGPLCGESYVEATALGGGIEIPPAASGTGATVTIADSVIAGNRVAPSVTVPSVRSICPSGPCRFALAGGGGIDNWGTLTLRRTTISNNQVGGPLTSDADGAGILHEAGSLTLKHSIVSRNHAVATTPNGRFAESGGIFALAGTLTLIDSAVTRNVAALSSAFPGDVNQLAIGAGIHSTDQVSTTIRGSTIEANRLIATNTGGDAIAFSAGLHTDGPLVLRHSSVSFNHVEATTAPGSAGNAEADSGAGEINANATISRTRFVGNSVTASAPGGTASAASGAIGTAAFDAMTITDSVVSANRVTATTSTGSVSARAAGIANGGVLTIRGTAVTENTAVAIGPNGVAQGGGIWNGPFPDGPTPRLA